MQWLTGDPCVCKYNLILMQDLIIFLSNLFVVIHTRNSGYVNSNTAVIKKHSVTAGSSAHNLCQYRVLACTTSTPGVFYSTTLHWN